jgi:hypothetical protein
MRTPDPGNFFFLVRPLIVRTLIVMKTLNPGPLSPLPLSNREGDAPLNENQHLSFNYSRAVNREARGARTAAAARPSTVVVVLRNVEFDGTMLIAGTTLRYEFKST